MANKLAACGAAIDENDLILHTLNGLPIDYRPFKAINTRSMANPASLEVLHTLLIYEELSLDETQPIVPLTEPSTALSATRTFSHRG